MCLVPFTVQKCTCEIHLATFWESGQQITLRNKNSLKLFFNLEQNDTDLRHTFSEHARTYFRTGNANNSTSLYLSLLSKPPTLLFLNLTLNCEKAPTGIIYDMLCRTKRTQTYCQINFTAMHKHKASKHSCMVI